MCMYADLVSTLRGKICFKNNDNDDEGETVRRLIFVQQSLLKA
jgi:hypothetical protein